MTPKFIREVHKTTIDLLRQLAAIREMTNISVHIKNKPSTQPISLGYRTEQKIGNIMETFPFQLSCRLIFRPPLLREAVSMIFLPQKSGDRSNGIWNHWKRTP